MESKNDFNCLFIGEQSESMQHGQWHPQSQGRPTYQATCRMNQHVQEEFHQSKQRKRALVDVNSSSLFSRQPGLSVHKVQDLVRGQRFLLTFFRKDLINLHPYQVLSHGLLVIMLLVMLWMELPSLIAIQQSCVMEWNPSRACIPEQVLLAMLDFRVLVLQFLIPFHLLWVHLCQEVQPLNLS